MKALWQFLSMYDVGNKLLNGIRIIYINSLACVRVNGGKSECFGINRGVRQGCMTSPWLFNVYMDAVMKEVKVGIARRRGRFQEEGREWRLPGLLYVYHVVLCGESKEDMRAMVVRFTEVYRRRDLKVNTSKSKVMVLSGGGL